MRVWIRRGLAALLMLVIVLAAVIFVGLQKAERRAQRHIDVKVQPVAVPADAAALERGRYLYSSRGCADCHGADGGGRTFVKSATACTWPAPTSRAPPAA